MIRNYADHSANERTFLAWVRTVISIVGFGLAAARLSATDSQLWSEIALLVTGAIVVLIAYSRMRHLHKRIRSSETIDDAELGIDSFLVALVVALFLMLGIFAAHVGRVF
ncbi:MAG: DUF202 domain-containing protein [Ahrensia sp.]|nr:DUF202 domain-containing protein [Ahrensia sp.]